MTYGDKIEALLDTVPKEYLGPIAADFAEDVLYIYEAYDKNSSALVAAIAAARANDVEAAADAMAAVTDAAYASYDASVAATHAAKAAGYAAKAGHDTSAAAMAFFNAVEAADTYGDKDIYARQYNILKKWSDKGVIDKVILALYEA